MAKANGIHYTNARDGKYTRADISKVERHNERKNEAYSNPNIELDRTDMNLYFKKPTDNYTVMFDHMLSKNEISTKGLKGNAVHYGELLFDVNTTYFEEHGGYVFAKEFFSKAYDYAVKEIGGEEYILSAMMHADERNSVVSEALGKDVYHYHLHVVYIPVVQKEVKWSKRCKDKSLVGTVKEVITQVSHSKKWKSEKVMGEDGKMHLVKSYSLLQDKFFEYMHNCGYEDIERGAKGSTTKHLSTIEFMCQQEQKHFEEKKFQVLETEDVLAVQTEAIEENNSTIQGQNSQIKKGQVQLEKVANKKAMVKDIDMIETKSAMFANGKVMVDEVEFENIKTLAQKQVVSVSKERKYKAENTELREGNQSLRKVNAQQHKELLEFKSVRAKLRGNKSEMRIAELEKFQEAVYKFLDKVGIRKQFEEFMKGFRKQRNEVGR